MQNAERRGRASACPRSAFCVLRSAFPATFRGFSARQTMRSVACLTLQSPLPREAVMARSGIIVTVAVALVVSISSTTFADHRAEAEQARRRLEYAEARLAGVAHEHGAAQSALSDVLARHASAANGAAAAQQQADASAAAIADAQGRIGAVGDASRNLGQEIAQKRGAFDQAKPIADTIVADIEKYRSRKIAAFEA